MGTHYRLFIFDEFDWEYVNFDRSQVIEQVIEIKPDAEVEASLKDLIIFNIGKTPPVMFSSITADKICYTTDTNKLTLVTVEESK